MLATDGSANVSWVSLDGHETIRSGWQIGSRRDEHFPFVGQNPVDSSTVNKAEILGSIVGSKVKSMPRSHIPDRSTQVDGGSTNRERTCDLLVAPGIDYVGCEMKLGLCIPTYNASRVLGGFLPALLNVRDMFEQILVIDSSSSDDTVALFEAAKISPLIIPSAEFDHGGTRQLGIEMLSGCDVVAFLTQDAVLASPESIKKLVAAFDDPAVAIAYGRQLPRPEAGPIEAHARLFGYPSQSRIKSKDSIAEIGLRAAVVSNSFAAYRRSVLMELGGFPKGTLFGEDTLTGAKAILAGYKIAYVGDAEVYHSHDYTLLQEFRRYFDNGVFYSREKWIQETFGAAEGSGKAYVLSEMRHLSKTAPWLLPLSVLTVLVKYAGYRVGVSERCLPTSWKLRLSMNKPFWRREIANGK